MEHGTFNNNPDYIMDWLILFWELMRQKERERKLGYKEMDKSLF